MVKRGRLGHERRCSFLAKEVDSRNRSEEEEDQTARGNQRNKRAREDQQTGGGGALKAKAVRAALVPYIIMLISKRARPYNAAP